MQALFVVSEEGFWAEECFVPLQTLKDEGFDVTVATPSGADPIVDESSLDPDEIGEEKAREYGALYAADSSLNNPIALSEAVHREYDVAVFPGGHGTVFDVNHDQHARQILADAVENQKALVICHAVGLLGFTRDEEGNYLVDGKNVTGFPNAWEEDIVDEYELLPNGIKLPYRVEDEVNAAGGNWNAELEEETSVTVDGNLITARGPESSQAAAETLLEEISDR